MSEKNKLGVLFTPIEIGKTTIKNRIIFPSMCTYYSDDNGSITPRIREFVRVRARGGVGMFILPGTPYGIPNKGRPAISDDRYIFGWKDLKEIASYYGMSLFCQLHGSRLQVAHGNKTLPEHYTTEEIYQIIYAYAEGARRAKEAGLNGVEIHGGNAQQTHQIAQFLSPFYNRREDDYGGDMEGRSRFALEVIRAIKKIAGTGFTVIFRFSVEEYIPGGRELVESLQLAPLLERAGADALHISVGTKESIQWISPSMDVSPGFSVFLASEVKKAVSVPVIASGRINDPYLAAQIIHEGSADLVAMGRALLADPDLPKKSFEGRTDEIRRCIACNQGCRPNDMTQGALCLQNPAVGREGTLRYAKVSHSDRKTVLIAGAGPAGLEAACVLSERGHRVKIFERNSIAGGTFLLASKPPKKEGILEVIRYRMKRLQDLGIEITFNTKVGLKIIQEVAPDIVIIATGSSPDLSSFPIKGDEFFSADEVLSGILPKGRHILVLGGGMVGCEVADYLINQGYKVDIVEQLPSLAGELNRTRRFFLLERLEKNDVRSFLEAKLLEVHLPKIRLEVKDREEIYGDYDSVVYAIGRKSNNELVNVVKDYPFRLRVFSIGDALSPRTAFEAIHEAALLSGEI